MAERAVEPQLATEGEAFGVSRAQLTRGDEEADSDGKIEARTPLAHAGRREVHRDPTQRPRQAARQHGGTHRSRASRTAASGSPTIVKPGRPLETWTSTETARPTAPLRVAEATEAST